MLALKLLASHNCNFSHPVHIFDCT